MDKKEKEILKHIVKKELKQIKMEEKQITFPALKFIESVDLYEKELKQILKKLN